MIKKSLILILTLLICLFPFGCEGSCALKGDDGSSSTSQSGSLGSTDDSSSQSGENSSPSDESSSPSDESSSPSDESSSSSGRPNELPLLPV